jgi:hypothetical protein
MVHNGETRSAPLLGILPVQLCYEDVAYPNHVLIMLVANR